MKQILLPILFSIACACAETGKGSEQTQNPEIQKIDQRLDELRVIWRQEQAIINGYTKNRTVPVKEGSREYFACVEAAKRTKLAEDEAAKLKAQRERILQSGGSGTDTAEGAFRKQALAKMTREEKLAVLEKDQELLRKMKDISSKAAKGELDASVADQMLQRITIERINLYKSHEYDEEARKIEDAYDAGIKEAERLKREILGPEGQSAEEEQGIRKDGESDQPSPKDSSAEQEEDINDDGVGIRPSTIEPKQRPKMNGLSPTRKKLVGYWVSVKEIDSPPTYELDEGVSEDDLSDEAKLAKKTVENMKHSYACYGPRGFLTSGEWTPYEKVEESGDIIQFDYFVKNSAFKSLLNERIKIDGDESISLIGLGERVAYRRISEKEWFERTQGIEWIVEGEVLVIKSNMPLIEGH